MIKGGIGVKSEYNLLHEPWIIVRTKQQKTEKVSLIEALCNAHQYLDVAGETETQDASLRRLMLAVLFAVFLKYDAEGEARPIEKSADALRRWKSLWELKRFPVQPIRSYLEKYEGRFFLFDEKYPFWQIPNTLEPQIFKLDKKNQVSKLTGEVLKSGNSERLFSCRTAIDREGLDFDEAARWLVYINLWDDVSLKKGKAAEEKEKIEKENKGYKLPSARIGWMGQLGYIEAVGDNLFETLMLNLTLLKHGKERWSDDERPIWENEYFRTEERVPILLPDNPAALYTVQFRRPFLIRDGDKVTGYYIVVGDILDAKDALTEQQTLWKKGKDGTAYFPKIHTAGFQMWRDFSSIACFQEDQYRPGIVEWISLLQKDRKTTILSKEKVIRFRIISTTYDKKNKTSQVVQNTFSDSLVFHANLLSDLGRGWCIMIEGEIEKCEEAAKRIGALSMHLSKASGMNPTIGVTRNDRRTDMEKRRDADKMQFYSRIDILFRSWLQEPDALDAEDRRDKLQEEWHETARKTAIDLANAMVASAGPGAFTGRAVKEQDKTRYFSSPKAMNQFMQGIYSIYPKEKG